MDVRELGALALVIVVASIIISMGAQILGSLSVNQCDYTWITNTTVPTGQVINNPLYTANYGCCTTLDSGNNCTVWTTDSAALNTSAQGLAGMVTFGDWVPLIALVIAASIVIGVIVKYLGETAGGV